MSASLIAPRSFFRAAYIYGRLSDEAYIDAFTAAYEDQILATKSASDPRNYAKRQLVHYNQEPHRYTGQDYARRPAKPRG